MCSSKLSNGFAILFGVIFSVIVSVLFFFNLIGNFMLATEIALFFAAAVLLALIAIIAFAALRETPALAKGLYNVGALLVFSTLASLVTSITIYAIGLGLSIISDILMVFFGTLFFSMMVILLGILLIYVARKLLHYCSHC